MEPLESPAARASLAEIVRPNESTFSAEERDVLGAYWHPIAYESELGGQPLSRRLLDVRLVVFKHKSGITVARDLCLHRGATLSRGRVENGCLVCVYHGFTYDGDGDCVRIPAQDASLPISSRLKLKTFPVALAYGVIWTCLLPPAAAPLPDWSIYNESGWQSFAVPAAIWNVAATRQVENFNDVAHLSFVHSQTFGNPAAPQIENYKVIQHDHSLEFNVGYLQIDRDTFAQSAEVISPVKYRYELTLPFASWLTITAPGDRILRLFDIASPVEARKTRVYFLMSRNYSQDEPIGPAVEFQLQVNSEDRPVVEDQYPEDLPLDLHDEIHVPADRLAVAYRKRLVAMGLGRNLTG